MPARYRPRASVAAVDAEIELGGFSDSSWQRSRPDRPMAEITPKSPCEQASGENRGVQFSRDLRDRVADGSITVSYRLWSRPQVKVGGTYRSTGVLIEVDDIDLVPFSSVTDEDLAQTGEPDLESLRVRTAHAGPVHDDTLVYRVEFHVVRRPDSAVHDHPAT